MEIVGFFLILKCQPEFDTSMAILFQISHRAETLILQLRLSLENVQYFVTNINQATFSFTGMIGRS